MSEVLAANIQHNSMGGRIVRGTISAFVLNVLAFGCLFIGQLLIARLLSQTEYAEFTIERIIELNRELITERWNENKRPKNG